MIKKLSNGSCLIALALFFGLLTSCEKENIQKELEPNTVKVETINGLDDPVFLDLVQPFTVNHAAGRVLNSSDYQSVEKITGIDYTNYTLPIEKLNNTPSASHSLVLSMRNDTARYNLMEIIPEKLWSGDFEEFTGTINTYLIEFSEQDGNSSGRVWNKTTVKDCMKIVIDRIVYNSDNQAYAIYHWEEDPDCDEGGGGGSSSSGGGNYYWLPSWGSKDPSNFSDGGLAGSGGSLSGSGSRADSRKPKYEEVPIALEEVIAAQIEQVLQEDPYTLLEINCDQIEKWQALAQNGAPDDIKDKINYLQNQNESWFDDWAIQTLNGANGTIVNMDYFSVNVSTLPNNPNSGSPFSAQEFLDYFRRNINDFAEGSTFAPYCETTTLCTQETALWNSDNPTGAIIYIDIPVNDGVVVCSEYTSSYWYFMTLEAPGAGNHPVSGTRQFGFEPNSNGGYSFFVRGVDRFDSNLIENASYMTFGGEPFAAADDLWESFQNKLNAYVNNNGGSSQANEPVKNRADWDKIRDVLEGTRPISDIGCN